MSRPILSVAFLIFSPAVNADEERIPYPIVVSGQDGTCYVKSVPFHISGTSGITRVYRVDAEEDELKGTYDWYSFGIYPWCYSQGSSVAIVRVDSWSLGREAQREHSAISFFVDGELLKQYPTLDIAIEPENVVASVSHYRVFRQVEGVVKDGSGRVYFSVITIDGREMRFEIGTGNIRDIGVGADG